MFVTRGQRKAQSKEDREARDYQARLDREARDDERRHQEDLYHKRREQERLEKEREDWRDLLEDMKSLLRGDYARYDDKASTQRARNEWETQYEKRLTGLALSTKNPRAKKIARQIRVEFHRLARATLYFRNRLRDDPRWDAQYEAYDLAWNEALFLMTLLSGDIDDEKAPKRSEWPGNLRNYDDEADESGHGE